MIAALTIKMYKNVDRVIFFRGWKIWENNKLFVDVCSCGQNAEL